MMDTEGESEATASDSPLTTSGGRRVFRACAVLLFGAELLITGQAMVEYGASLLFNRDPRSDTDDTATATDTD